jgi:hypothetical protein
MAAAWVADLGAGEEAVTVKNAKRGTSNEHWELVSVNPT